MFQTFLYCSSLGYFFLEGNVHRVRGVGSSCRQPAHVDFKRAHPRFQYEQPQQRSRARHSLVRAAFQQGCRHERLRHSRLRPVLRRIKSTLGYGRVSRRPTPAGAVRFGIAGQESVSRNQLRKKCLRRESPFAYSTSRFPN